MTFTDWTGTIGVAMLLIAFFLNLNNTIKKEGYIYLLLNIVGAGLACFASVLLDYWPFIILEGCWTIVSVFSLMKYMNTRKPV
ncbi:MAG TPA: hypothetical protein VK166_00395 [Chitinophagaceae bacterium]|nr:hypothetical protein [Chitinophagaceae bacterium]